MATDIHIRPGARLRALVFVALSLVVVATTDASASDARSATHGGDVRVLTIEYTAHNGARRPATVLLPAWYGPANNPPLPVVISPHGRDATGKSNAEYFGNLPAVGNFAVISPDGMGRRLKLKSYGYAGQVDDLAKMPEFAVAALPWLRLDRRRVYALGSSMGGHETLMLVARHPELLAGAAAMDSVTDLVRRYGQLPQIPCNAACAKTWGVPFGVALQSAMRREVGASPGENPPAYAARSPIAHARAIAFSGVPLQIWWSHEDRIVFDQEHQSEAFFHELKRLNPRAPVSAYIGRWAHSKEMRASELLPIALAGFDLLPRGSMALPRSVRYEGPQSWTARQWKRASGEAFLIATSVVRNVWGVLADVATARSRGTGHGS